MIPEVHAVGDGPAVLLLHGGAEDAEMLRPQADSLAAAGLRAIWYDRRGTGRSRSLGWATDRGDRHADDAAAVLAEFGPATVVGFSSGGVVALALAARHPGVAREVIAWEPAAIGMLPDGDKLHAAIMEPVEAHLDEHPGDWAGAWRTALTVISDGRADLESPQVRASLVNAEVVIRDDARLLTARGFAEGELPATGVTVAISSAPDPAHAAIAERLGELIGCPPVVVPGATGHEVYLSDPAVLTAWLTDRIRQ